MNHRLLRVAVMATAVTASLDAGAVTSAADYALPIGHDGYPKAIAAHGDCYANGWATAARASLVARTAWSAGGTSTRTHQRTGSGA